MHCGFQVLHLNRIEEVRFEVAMLPQALHSTCTILDYAGEIPVLNGRMKHTFPFSMLHQRVQSTAVSG